MAFKMKGSPHKLGTIDGASPLKLGIVKTFLKKHIKKHVKKSVKKEVTKVTKRIDAPKKTKLLTNEPVYRSVDPSRASNITKPLDFTKVGKHGEPGNIAWFGPHKKAYAESGKQIFQANLKYNKPYHVSRDKVWTGDMLKKIMRKGHDIILAGSKGSKPYAQIPLNKDAIKNLKRIK